MCTLHTQAWRQAGCGKGLKSEARGEEGRDGGTDVGGVLNTFFLSVLHCIGAKLGRFFLLASDPPSRSKIFLSLHILSVACILNRLVRHTQGP